MWFAVPFIVGTVLFTGLRLAGDNKPPSLIDNTAIAPDDSILVGLEIPQSGLLEVQSRLPASELGLTIPDTTVIILLGGASCSGNQVSVLRDWAEKSTEPGLRNHPVMAIYADPLVGIEQGTYESLILRRVSEATFPFLISQDRDFNPRAMGIPTPQVVLVESQVITHVYKDKALFPTPNRKHP